MNDVCRETPTFCECEPAQGRPGMDKKVGGITYTKQMPNFLKQMMQLDESGVRARESFLIMPPPWLSTSPAPFLHA